jgi:hypothetical protein
MLSYSKTEVGNKHSEQTSAEWSEEAGETLWCYYNVSDGKISTDESSIITNIRCKPNTPRLCRLEQMDLTDIRLKVEKHIKNSYFKSLQAPIGVKPVLKAWMVLL